MATPEHRLKLVKWAHKRVVKKNTPKKPRGRKSGWKKAKNPDAPKSIPPDEFMTWNHQAEKAMIDEMTVSDSQIIATVKNA
jgi:hypothetical protein